MGRGCCWGYSMGRRAIRSWVSSLLLLLLHVEGPLSSVQLGRRLGLESSRILPYLHYWRKYGLVYKNGYLWGLTDKGHRYVLKYFSHLQSVYLDNRKNIKLHKLTSTNIKLHKLISSTILSTCKCDNCRVVVEFLVDFRLRTGRRYWWPPQGDLATALWEEISSSSKWQGVTITDISNCLRELEAAGIIYITMDKRRGVPKIRINRTFDYLFES